MKIMFLTNIPAPYTIDFFELIGKKCELTVVFERSRAKDRENSWLKREYKNFKGIFLRGLSVSNDMAFCPQVIGQLRKESDMYILGNYSSPTGILALLFLKSKRIPFAIHADGGIINFDENKFKRKIKKFLISSASIYFSSGEETSKYLKFYGADKKKIIKYPFTSVWKKEILDALPDKTYYRERLQIKERRVVVSIGQMIPRKGFDVLLQAVQIINTDDIGYYLIGGDPYQELKEFVECNRLNNVHFISFLNREKIMEYLKAADIFVLLTREDIWGLVINEACAMGLPIISTDTCIAATEMVENGENGYIVRNEDASTAAEKMKYLLENPELCKKMGQESLKVANVYSLENMSEVYYQNIEKAIR
ncbi:glycosyltransferase family 4 protein [Candidatus Merdisoma sp. HCP28S3_D10]|uniref:glycosyltransferase family 4 protein n=1 Tax=unclassified Candidatus Merdisoma TaxID=3099611 RepID=UPI003F8AEA58